MTMRNVDLLIHSAAQLITCATNSPKRGQALRELGIITDGAVCIDEGVIVATGTTADIRAQLTAQTEIDASGKVVMPGFVDCHTHVVHGGERINEFEQRLQGATYMEILNAGGGILSTVQATRNATLDQLISQTRARLDIMLGHGSTTVESKSGYGLDTETELKMLEVSAILHETHPLDLIPTFLGAHSIPQAYKGRTDEYVDLVINEMIPAVARWYTASIFAKNNIPLFIDVFCEQGVFDVAQTRRILKAGAAHGMKLKAHVDEFVALGGTSLAVNLGAVSVDHLDATGDDEIKRLAQSNTIAVGLPAVNLNLGNTHYAKLRMMIDHGAAVALATDYNPGSAPCFSMSYVMGLATRYQKLLPAEALNAATINAAYAAGVGDRAGSLEAGKQADIVILNTHDYRHLTYYLGENFVERVIKQGNLIYES